MKDYKLNHFNPIGKGSRKNKNTKPQIKGFGYQVLGFGAGGGAAPVMMHYQVVGGGAGGGNSQGGGGGAGGGGGQGGRGPDEDHRPLTGGLRSGRGTSA